MICIVHSIKKEAYTHKTYQSDTGKKIIKTRTSVTFNINIVVYLSCIV